MYFERLLDALKIYNCFELFLGFSICCIKACHTFGRHIETLDGMYDLMNESRVYKIPSKMLKTICLLSIVKFGYLICIMMKGFRDSDMDNIMFLYIWFYFLAKLYRYTIFNLVKMLDVTSKMCRYTILNLVKMLDVTSTLCWYKIFNLMKMLDMTRNMRMIITLMKWLEATNDSPMLKKKKLIS